MTYLHFISHRTSNSSSYAYLCETAVVARYLYKLLRGTVLSPWLVDTLQPCSVPHVATQLGWKRAQGLPPVAAQQQLLPFAFSHPPHGAEQSERSRGVALSYACSSNMAAAWL